jgi:hypothetical protein
MILFMVKYNVKGTCISIRCSILCNKWVIIQSVFMKINKTDKNWDDPVVRDKVINSFKVDWVTAK